MTTIAHLSHTRGDTFKRRIIFKDSSGVAIDITGSAITGTIRKNPDDTTFIAQGDAVLTTPLSGIATLTLAATLFNIPNGTYFYDIRWIDSAGAVTTFMKGNFEISYSVT